MYTCACTCKVQFTLISLDILIQNHNNSYFQNFDEQLATVSSLTAETCILQNQTNDEVTIIMIWNIFRINFQN